ncbi:MAG: type II toxin-antitoxin system VapC family toxin [Chloroflexi bacterium]|nr:type II toxin-antitoxin system VapC family toxin [Chloroflexota bacterium]MYK34252.1 type II toxin-antitoxin system VapC family toxin [Chloroflexota bacterium]
MAFLVDTDWAVDYLRGVSAVAERVAELAADGLGLSIISLAELYEGVYYSRDPEASSGALARFLRIVQVLPIDEAMCRIFARERGRLRAAGASIGDLDLLIGATALRHGLTLLTNNRRHFERLEGLGIVSV